MNSSVSRAPREKLFTNRSRSDFRSGEGASLSTLVFFSSAMGYGATRYGIESPAATAPGPGASVPR